MHKSSVLTPPLPMRGGVSPSRVYLPDGPWETVLQYLLYRYSHLPEGLLEQRISRGDIVDSNGTPISIHTPYKSHQWLWYYREVENEAKVPFDLPIIYINEHIVVVDKPHFLASIPGGRYLRETVVVRLRDKLNCPYISPIHRLDRDTAGVMVLSRSPAQRGLYQSMFQNHKVNKIYEAVAEYRPDLQYPYTHTSCIEPGNGFLMKESAIKPANSHTTITVLRKLEGSKALYRLMPVTGRKHQLRVHMSSLGMPIINDDMYPVLLPQRSADDFSEPLQLLARGISFTDPVSGKPMSFTSSRSLDLAANFLT